MFFLFLYLSKTASFILKNSVAFRNLKKTNKFNIYMAQKATKWIKKMFDEEDFNDTQHSHEPSLKKQRTTKSDLPDGPANVQFSTSENKKINKTNIKLSHSSSSSPEFLFNPSNWIENFQPKTIDELAVHPKKIEEVLNWLKNCESHDEIKIKKSGPILLLTGPAGSGKTATIQTISQQLKYEISEWITPVDIELTKLNQENKQQNILLESQIEIFSEFLFRSSRYVSVLDNFSKKLILVEDFPNIFLKNSDDLHEILERYRNVGKSPLVFIVTDTKSKRLDISYNLFNDAILAKFQIHKICFNPASTSFLKKAVKNICAIMSKPQMCSQYKQITSDQIDSIILTSQGDIRNAMINLHFASQKNSVTLPTELIKDPKIGGKGKSKKLKSIGCDSTITFMHALGRVLNPKYNESRSSSSNESNKLLHSPEQICDDFSSQPSTFINLLFTNYLGHYQSIDDALMAADIISQSDVYSNEWRDDNLVALSLNMVIRGIMVYNQNPARGWIPIKANMKKTLANEIDIPKTEDNINCMSNKVFALDVKPYAKIISNKTS